MTWVSCVSPSAVPDARESASRITSGPQAWPRWTHFSAFHAEKRWRELGHGSAFAYLRGEFKLSEGAAYNRIVAAELIHRIPEVEAAVRSGELCFSTVHEVAKVLTPENKAEVLPLFLRKSRREAERIAASIRPAEVIPLREVVTAIRPTAAG